MERRQTESPPGLCTTLETVGRDVMRHWIMSSYEADAEGLSADDILGRILDHIPVP